VSVYDSHYGIQGLCRVPVILDKGLFALGEAFAECNTRQRPLGKAPNGKGGFAECQLSGTRQNYHVGQQLAAALPSA